MNFIREKVEMVNREGKKALSVFLTAGYPQKNNFTETALNILDAGADMLEIGIPFSDPLADGPVIQSSSQIALNNGVKMKDIFYYSQNIRSGSDKPLILMGYANPIKKYGITKFLNDAKNSGVNGLIVPDVTLEEYDSFYSNLTKEIEIILLSTPTSPDERIKYIDSLSRGFVYCVSSTGTTGMRDNFSIETIENLKRTYSLVNKNKMMIGFGISKPEDIKNISAYCDGVIVGSRIIKSLAENKKIKETLKTVSELSDACTGKY